VQCRSNHLRSDGLACRKTDGCRPFANLIGDLLSVFDPHAADSGNVNDGDFALRTHLEAELSCPVCIAGPMLK